MTERYIARRALTDEPLDWDVPLATNGPTRSLSAVGMLSGTVAPEIGYMLADDGRPVLDEWGTYLIHEVDGVIRWEGIVTGATFNGPEWQIEAAGFATHLHGTIFRGHITGTGLEPVGVMRRIWADAQAQPDTNLGVVVVGDVTDRRIGTTEEPYELAWFDLPDCGKEVDTLAAEAPFDWIERHRWDGDNVVHEIVVGYPRLGRLREDLAFVYGENVVEPITVERDGGEYASDILGIGAGEGAGAIRSTVAERTGRIRRTAILTDKTVTTTERMDALSTAELRRRLTRGIARVTEIVVVDHDNAQIAALDVGDTITIDAPLQWLGRSIIRARVVTIAPQGADRYRLTLEESEITTEAP